MENIVFFASTFGIGFALGFGMQLVFSIWGMSIYKAIKSLEGR